MNFSLIIALSLILGLPQQDPVIESAFIHPEKVQEAKNYCLEKDLNHQIAIFIDMTIHSGKKRFFLYFLSFKKIIFFYFLFA